MGHRRTAYDRGMSVSSSSVPDHVEASLCFARQDRMREERGPEGVVLRAAPLANESPDNPELDPHVCAIHDLDVEDTLQPRLDHEGFCTVTLAGDPALDARLEAARRAGTLSTHEAHAIARALRFRAFDLPDGRRLRLLFVAPEGIILRVGGPNGRAHGARPITQTDGHVPATVVHADQDVYGTPLREWMFGFAPRLFHHRSPNGVRRSRLMLVNVWIPLAQVTRPLAILDGTTLDRRNAQARYALPTDGFLERSKNVRVNSIWSIAHAPEQRWYFRSGLDASRAHVFDTLSTAHGAFVLPGESLAARLSDALAARVDAFRRGDSAPVDVRAPDEAVVATTRPLQRAIATLRELLREADLRGESLAAHPEDAWFARSAAAIDTLVRKSIELRCVAWLS